jgi:hypothetical protein
MTYRCFAVGDLAQVSLVDRESGAVLEAHYYRGEYWVAGRPGGRYAIDIRNRSGERLMAVTSVDGVNVLSGATAGWDQGGYVFDPGQHYQITGWRKTDAEVAAFTFTDSRNSYADRTGRPANVGVIGVAVFREQPPPPVYAPPPRVTDALPLPSDPDSAARRSRMDSQAPAAAPPAAPAASAAESAARRESAPLAKLGTGHGEREYSYVSHTNFVRRQPQPNEVIRIHYDSLDNLFAMGIVKRPVPLTPLPNPFPASPDRQYVPDPPG